MYFRLENCSGIINFAGFTQAAESFTGKPLADKETRKFAEELIQTVQAYVNKVGRKHGKRLFPALIQSPEASARLAQLDVEKYGVAKVKVLGTRDKPFYPTVRRLQAETGNFLTVPTEQLDALEKLKGLTAGGNLTVIDLNTSEVKAEDLQKLTLNLMQNHQLEFFTYNRPVTYCSNCQKSWYGNLHKCPSCGSMGTLALFDRFNGT
jgi:anaerobic ribonucleoside-triphosphate reductase